MAAAPITSEVYVAELQAIRKELNQRTEMYAHSNEFKAALFPVLAATDHDASEIFDSPQEELLPEIYLHPSLWNSRIYKIVRRLLVAIGKQITRGSGLPIAKTTSQVLYEDDPRTLADAMNRIDLNRRRRAATAVSNDPAAPGPSAQPGKATSVSGTDSAGRAASAIHKTFKNSEERFSGDVYGKISLHVIRRRYLTAIRRQNINGEQEVFLLVNCLTGPAEEFYYSDLREQVQTIGEAFQELEEKFNTLLHQLHTRNYLNGMTFDNVKQECKGSDMQTLETIYQRILTRIPQARRTYTVEDAKVDMLYNATKEHPWSRTALANQMAQSQTSNQDWTFDQFKQNLTTQLAACAERKPGTAFHGIVGFNATGIENKPEATPTYFSETPCLTQPQIPSTR